MASLSPYEQNALGEVQRRRADNLENSPTRLVPKRVQDAVERGTDLAGEKIKSTAAGKKLADGTQAAYARAARGLGKATSKFAEKSLSEQRILRTYKRAGHPVADLVKLRELDLQIVDGVRPKRLDLVYASLAGLEGAASGAVVSGGEALATFGSVASAGAAAAPGLGAIATAMAADATFALAATSRAVAHVGAYYGYDPTEPGESLFAMSVINLGTATTSGAKYYAYRELSQLAQGLARRATWTVLNEHILTRVAQKFASDMSVRLTQRKLGQIVPVAGILIGAGLNYHLLDEVCESAYWAYRERFLRDKEGGTAFDVATPTPEPRIDDGPADNTEDTISLLAALDDPDENPGTSS